MVHIANTFLTYIAGLSGSSLEMFESATEYGERVVGKCVKVAVFGCNLRFTCKVGQYILIPSLHFILKDGGGATRVNKNSAVSNTSREYTSREFCIQLNHIIIPVAVNELT